MNDLIKCYGECKQLLPTTEFHVSRKSKRGWKMTCKTCSNAYNRRYRQANPEQFKGYVKKDIHSAACARWSQNNRDKRVRNELKRRAAKLNSKGTYSIEEWNELVGAFGNRCANPNCESIWPYKITVDHVVALSKGGSNTIDNIQPLCRSCNASKGVRMIDYRLILERVE